MNATSANTTLDAQAFNMDSLLEGTLDDLAQVPDFVAYPPGSHKVIINWEMPTKERPTTIGLKLSAIETLELNDASHTPLVPGSMTTISFKMDNEFGQSNYRKVITSLSAHFGAGTNREIMEKSAGAECLVITTSKTGKKTEQNPDPVSYTRLVEIAPV